MTTTLYRKTQLTLPPEVVSAFQAIGDDLDERNAYASALRRAGWTLQSISDATGVTRERIRQINTEVSQADINALSDTLPIPDPPLKTVRLPKQYTEPDPAKLARLLDLQPLAQRVRSNSEQYREEGKEYTALVWEVTTEDGVSLYRLAKRLGVTHAALRFRLVRYGYKTPQSGKSRVYTPIATG